jgi:CRISPR/Cas system CSM-associated protein Csm3 (group 7 of RAMP superfamily)
VIIHKITGILTALSPIFHGGNEKTGSVVLLNRLKFIANGKPVDVPIVSGNQVRGRLRRLLSRDFLELAEYQLDLSQKKHQKLYHTLFAGGVLTAVEEEESGVVDLNLKSRVVKYILPIRLFGASYANQMVEGRVLIGHMLPVCKELKEFTGIDSDVSFYQLITRMFQTRRDELRVASKSGEEEEEEEKVQMIVEYECFAPGTRFYHEIALETTSEGEELDLSTLYRAIELWRQKPFIGGKSSIGFGKLRIEYTWPKQVDSKPYLQFIEKNKDEIHKVLDELAEVL